MSTDLVIQEDAGSAVTLFGTENPAEVIERAAKVATTLADLVRKQNLVVRIGQSDHCRVEAWTLLGSMLGVFPVVEWTRPVMDGDARVGWEARVEARTRGGEVVGAAEAECLRDERTWKGRDDYALRSMAQTRAVSKAMRLPLGFVMQLAGFSPTPAEEMPQPGTVQHPEGEPVPYDDGKFPPDVIPEGATAAQKKNLNRLVGTLRTAGHVTTEQLWRAGGLNPELGRGDDGEIHWSPLRDSLTKAQATVLLERLLKLDENVAAQAAAVDAAASEFKVPDGVQQELAS